MMPHLSSTVVKLLLCATLLQSQKVGAESPVSAEFDFRGFSRGWGVGSMLHSGVDVHVTREGLSVLANAGGGESAWVDSPPQYGVHVDGATHIVLRARYTAGCISAAWQVDITADNNATLGIASTASTLSVPFAVVADGEWHDYTVRLLAESSPLCTISEHGDSGLCYVVSPLRFRPCIESVSGPATVPAVDVAYVAILQGPVLRRVEGCGMIRGETFSLGPISAGDSPYIPFARR